MWKKIKNILTVIGSFFVVFVLSALFFLLRRCNSDRTGSTGDFRGDNKLEEGITGSNERLRGIQERLDRAERILQDAIKRSREGSK